MILFDIPKLQKELSDLEAKTSDPDFWNNNNQNSTILKKITNIKSKIENYKKIETELNNLFELNELLKSESDDEIEKELSKAINSLEKKLDKLEISILLSDKYDSNNAIITLHPGAGGTEAQDWVQMLYRMYTRWANDNGYKVEELDYLEGEEAGIKSVTFLVSRRICLWLFKRRTGSS